MSKPKRNTDSKHQLEYQRQKRALDALPEGHAYPIFNGWHAIQSQRKSGYKNTARAAREIVDNAIEAGAKNVWITLDTISEEGRKKGTHKDRVSSVAFIDDGPGMFHESNERSMLRYALSWGGGSHFDDYDMIGRFGFGLPNSSVNQTQVTEVYTRTADDKAWNRAVLDITKEHIDSNKGVLNAPEVTFSELPAFVQKFLKERDIDLQTGTIVVWQNPDRLSVNGRETLREHIAHDFQIVYRGLTDRTKIFVESNEPLQTIDPLFLDPNGWLFLPEKEGGAQTLYDEMLSVKVFRDASSGQPRIELIGPEKGEDPVTGFTYNCTFAEAKEHVAKPPAGQCDVCIDTIIVRASYLPYPDFVKREKKTDPGRRFDIRKRNRGISFVRAGREIDTKDAFPKHDRKELGLWPLLQGYSYYWACEVQFTPKLDDVMGIGNDKQTCNPYDDFWRMLSQARVDVVLKQGNQKREEQGVIENRRRKEAANVDEIAAEAAHQADLLDPSDDSEIFVVHDETPTENGSDEPVSVPISQIDSSSHASSEGTELESPSAEPASATATVDPPSPSDLETPPEPDVNEYEANAAKYIVEKFKSVGGVFMVPVERGGRVVIKINTAHPWFDSYANTSDVIEARQATNLLLFALAKAELTAKDEAQRTWLEDLRCGKWTSFLRRGARVLKNLIPVMDKEEE